MVQIGAPLEVYAEPADAFVAGFLGSPPMNLFAHKNFILGFRPEHFLPPGSESGDRVTFRYRVIRVEHLGTDRLVYGILEQMGTDQIIIARLAFTANAPIHDGGHYEFDVPRRELRFFDKTSGQRIAPQPI